jgi:chemotaxis protein MotB
MKEAPVIRIVKKVKVHDHGSHGGSWKVAYADFVTAMMAFFLVMWILGMDETLREDIESYFNDPLTSSTTITQIKKLGTGGANPLATGFAGINARYWHELCLDAQKRRFEQVQKLLQQKVGGRADLSRLGPHVQIHVNASGLLIELIESREPLFFASGSAELPATTRALLGVIAGELARMANPIIVEGHTDAVPYAGRAGYTNWELSADRANAARRVMEAAGLPPHHVVQVRGYAATRLRVPGHPTDPSNRRVSILVHYAASALPTDTGEGETMPTQE